MNEFTLYAAEYVGPTDTRGSHIRVWCLSDGMNSGALSARGAATVPYSHEASNASEHAVSLLSGGSAVYAGSAIIPRDRRITYWVVAGSRVVPAPPYRLTGGAR